MGELSSTAAVARVDVLRLRGEGRRLAVLFLRLAVRFFVVERFLVTRFLEADFLRDVVERFLVVLFLRREVVLFGETFLRETFLRRAFLRVAFLRVVFFLRETFLREAFLRAVFLRLGVDFFALPRLRAAGEDLRVVFFLRDVEEDFLLAAM